MTIERGIIGTTDATAAASVYVEDVFSTYLYTGNGAIGQTITNGIDLATNGGLVWIKARNLATSTAGHVLVDTARGRGSCLQSQTANVQYVSLAGTDFASFNTNGFTIGYQNNFSLSSTSENFASWTFRKQAKFFDIVTYTGTGSARTISHNLGSTPGMIIVKRTDTTGNWQVYHRSLTSAANSIQLNLTNAQASATTVWNSTAPTSSVFSVGADATVNASGGTYVAYLFAGSNSGGFGAAGTDSVVACGSFNAIGQIELGWEPQFLLMKKSDQEGDWFIVDTMRPWNYSSGKIVLANTSGAELEGFLGLVTPNATGFYNGGYTQNFIYMAIRRGPMKTPTDATKVFVSSVATSEIAVTTGFPVDMQIATYGPAADTYNNTVSDRLRGASSTSTELKKSIRTHVTDAEDTANGYGSLNWSNTTFTVPSYIASNALFYSFRRAPGFFDVVCYTGTGSAQNVSHNLGVAPEMIIVKRRDAAANWSVYRSSIGSSGALILNSTTSTDLANYWSSNPTTSVFSPYVTTSVNASGGTYVAYLFATCPGVSKVGSYTGSGTTKQIDCGFTTGARFVLIKRTDASGDWYVWDTARGIVSGNDPYRLLNTSAGNVTTTDYIDPYSAGFEISSSAPAAINASGGTYIYLAIA